jgi:hypothetical protein
MDQTIGIAVVRPPGRTAAARGPGVDLDGDRKPEHFRMCASFEGLHFTVWSGEPLKGTLRWHHYYYLGYDTEPDCKPAEIRDPKPVRKR